MGVLQTWYLAYWWVSNWFFHELSYVKGLDPPFLWLFSMSFVLPWTICLVSWIPRTPVLCSPGLSPPTPLNAYIILEWRFIWIWVIYCINFEPPKALLFFIIFKDIYDLFFSHICTLTKELSDILQSYLQVDKNSDLLHNHFTSRPPPTKCAYIILAHSQSGCQILSCSFKSY